MNQEEYFSPERLAKFEEEVRAFMHSPEYQAYKNRLYEALQIYASKVEIPLEKFNDEEEWLEKAVEYLGPTEFANLALNFDKIPQHLRHYYLSARIAKSKEKPRYPHGITGPKKFTRDEKILYRQKWNVVKRRGDFTLEEWLEKTFGTHLDGSLNVPRSTFYSWPDH